MSSGKDKLRKIFAERIPLDKAQKALAEKGIEKLTDERAEQIARELEEALDVIQQEANYKKPKGPFLG